MSPLLATALLAGALAASPPPAGARIALLVANDVGTAGEIPLRHSGADAERLAAVLTELGGFERADVHVVKDRTAAEILDAVDAIARGPRAAMFLFYYSGHADAAALHPAGTSLPLDLLLHRLRGVGADLRVQVLDACQSGAVTRPKGSTPAPPFAVRLEEQEPSGDILISSSADDELSFESEHGGIFTLNLTAGLRGAADGDGDGQVTLGEVYAYAYAQTLRATLAASTGPQHARFRYDLSGRRDPVLTRLVLGSLLTLQPESDGEYVVFDGRERSVVTELAAYHGQPRRIALAPGGYVVQQRSPRTLRVARIQLAKGDDRVLAEHQMQELPLVRLARKGSPGERRLAISAGQHGSGLGPSGLFQGTVGVEFEGARWVRGADLSVSAGEEVHGGLPTRDVFVQASGELLYSWRKGAAALRSGPAAGIAYVRQAPQGGTAANGLGASLGLRLRADVDVTPSMGLFALADVRYLACRVEGDVPAPGFELGAVGFVLWRAYGFGLRIGF